MSAVTKSGLNLKWAPSDFKNDKDIIKLSVTQNGNSLEFVPDE